MELCPLEKVQHRIKLGVPLPFSVRDRASRLLLARHQVIVDEDQLEALKDRGAFVNLDELRSARAEIYEAPVQTLPGLWRKLAEQVSRVLLGMPSPQAPQALDDAARILVALCDRASDIAIFLTVRRDAFDGVRYGVARSVQGAVAALLSAQRLGWPAERCLTLVKAALTMNVGMLDLQERLSNQARLPNPAQRQAIRIHPTTGEQTLRACGIEDAEWLEAVAQHHEQPGGGGYPTGLKAASDMAGALRIADIYTAKLASRSGREPLSPDRAIRELVATERGNPCALALASELGPWPPGTVVRLQGGETGVVVQRTATPGAPMVAVLSNRRGEPLVPPVQRQAQGRDCGIASAVDERHLRVRVIPEALYAQARL